MESSGIPLALKQIHVMVNRPNFEYNPTGCKPLQLQASLTGAQGGTSSTTVPFQVTGCQTLPFKPAITATTQGKTSKADGASLEAHLQIQNRRSARRQDHPHHPRDPPRQAHNHPESLRRQRLRSKPRRLPRRL